MQLLDGGRRFLTTSYHAAVVAVDYKYTLRGVERGDEGYRELRAQVDARTAHRLFRVCKRNGGIFVKLGQYLSSMNHVLPREVTDILAPLQDNASTRTFEDLEVVLNEELGRDAAKNRFRSFDRTPIASASLAQVHFATTKSGQQVAVKIQYPGLRRQVQGDMFTIRTLVRALGFLFPQFEYSWMMPEYEDSITLELDFRQEARNGRRVAAMFRNDADVYVPRVLDDLSTSRVLCMEYIDGVKPTKFDKLEAMGIAPFEVASKVSRVFGDMIHVHGFVHCDPHPGNLLVRKDDRGRTQLVVLDHGMYRRLDQDFRAAYCRLWKGMILVDMNLIQQAARDMGVGEFADVLPLMFVFRPLSSSSKSTDVGKRMSKESRERLKARFKGTTLQDVNDFMKRLPRDLLFVGRSTNLVRSLNKELGGSSRQRIRVMAESATRGVALDTAYARRQTHPSFDNVTVEGDTGGDGSVAGDATASDGTAMPQTEGAAIQGATATAEGTTGGGGQPAVTADGVRHDTASVFSKHRINAPTDSEEAAAAGPLPWSAWWRVSWDVTRLRVRTQLLDTYVALRMWWRA